MPAFWRRWLRRTPSHSYRLRKTAHRQPWLAAEVLEARQLLAAAVTSYHNDSASTGQNSKETMLTPANVNSNTFGKLFTTPVDGYVYAQPLVVPGLNIPGQGVHDVVFVATEHDSLYAIDAESGAVLWKDSFLTSGLPGATSIAPVSPKAVASTDLTPEIGITATPAFDPSTNTLYVVTKTKEIVNNVGHFVQRLHAIDALTGDEKLGGPVIIGNTTYVNGVYKNHTQIFVNGTGSGNDGNGHVYFNALREGLRSALTLVNGQLYIAWASHGDNGPYHGWIAAYNPSTLALTGVLNTTPNGREGGIWMSGGKLASDAEGNLYVETGNGTFDGRNANQVVAKGLNKAGLPALGDYGDSVLKIAVDNVHNSPTKQNVNGWGLQVVDYFTPYNQAQLDAADLDLGSSAPLVLPDSAGDAAHQQLLLASGKQGTIYLLDRNNLGKYSANQAAELAAVVQEVPNVLKQVFDTPAYFNQQIYYVAAGTGIATSFALPDGSAQLGTTPASVSADTYGGRGATPSISSDDLTNGIVWTIDTASNELRAYGASGFNDELYTSDQAAGGRDALGKAVKFSVPTIANGYVYVGTTNGLVAYGLLTPPSTGP